MTVTEERLTRAEWEAVQRKEKCDRQGHDYEIMLTIGLNEPELVLCRRCGLQWLIAEEDPGE